MIFSISENEIEVQGVTFWEHWRDPIRIAGSDENDDAKWLPAEIAVNVEVENLEGDGGE
jgi:hypothetical protein